MTQLPTKARLTRNQQRTLLLLCLIGLLYFVALCFPNARGARDVDMLRVFSGDETITYPYVLHILETPKDIHDFTWRMIIYGDYHYGYPFYFLSMLAVLPARLFFGESFIEHTQLNLLLLRQLISVLPMILAAGALTFLQTRFHSAWRSVTLFVLILLIPGVVRSGMWWWHPDGLAVLCVALTLVFLDLDAFRLGRWFFLAAAACGMATAIKLVGVFFVFALIGYVIIAWRRRTRQSRAVEENADKLKNNPIAENSDPGQRIGKSPHPWKETRVVVLRSLAFVLVMAIVVVVSNPFLFYASQRAKLVRIQTEKNQELYNGYTHDDPAYYQKGPQWWASTLRQWYGPLPYLGILLGLAIIGSLWGARKLDNQLLLAWVIPYSLYLFYFVAVKPDHYWLPVLPVLFSAALNGVNFQPEGKNRGWILAFSALAMLALTWQLVQFTQADLAQYVAILGQEAAKGY